MPARVALTVAGHTHGGQVDLPFIGSPIVPSKFGQRYAGGHYVRQNSVSVAVEHEAIVGFYSLRETDEALELDLLYVEPGRTRSGVGAILLAHALQSAASTGHAHLIVESDPHAEAFYLRHGGQRTGERGSTVEDGRLLPVLTFDLLRRRAADRSPSAALPSDDTAETTQ